MEAQTGIAQDVATYTIDPAHSEVGFVARHLGFSKVRGRFKTFSGVVVVNPADLSSLEATVEIETKSIDTGEPKRDAHLRTNDFLNADVHPAITFESTGVRDVRGNDFKLEGKLTIRGVTRDVVIDGEFLGEGPDPWGGTRVGFEGKTTINRKDFGVNWNAALEAGGFLVGDEVTLELEVQAVLSEG